MKEHTVAEDVRIGRKLQSAGDERLFHWMIVIDDRVR